VPEVGLPQLADQINREHGRCRGALAVGAQHALECGKLLLAARARVRHGDWLPWLAANCPDISERLAQRYMQVARHFNKLGITPANATRVADLSFRQVLHLMTENARQAQRIAPLDRPDVLDQAAERVLEEAKAGNALDRLKRDQDRKRQLRDRDRRNQLRAQLTKDREVEFPRPPEPPPSIWRLGGLPEEELAVLIEELTRLCHWFSDLDRRLMEDHEYPIPRLAARVVVAIFALRERLGYDRAHLHHAVFGLRDLLAGGPAPQKVVYRWARKAGVSKGLLHLARKILAIEIQGGAGQPERWRLPAG
jgi:hypothetical protein